MKVTILQMDVVKDKEANLKTVENYFKTSLSGADLALLPEMFNCPYEVGLFSDYAEEEGGRTYQFLADLAKEYQVAIVGGSIPEKAGDKIYNTSYIFNKEGLCVGKHRKTHLFDVDIKGGITFKESDVLSPGQAYTLVDLGFTKIGVCICYDMRFPEFIRQMVLKGAQLVTIPAAFNTTTGPAHWSVTARARAIDNQCFVALASPARSKTSTYQAYGHSLMVNPWGEVLGEMDKEPGCLTLDLDLREIETVRQALPLLKHRKEEVYG